MIWDDSYHVSAFFGRFSSDFLDMAAKSSIGNISNASGEEWNELAEEEGVPAKLI